MKSGERLVCLRTDGLGTVEVVLDEVAQRNWSRVARGRVLAQQPEGVQYVFLKQFYSRNGAWGHKHFENEINAIAKYVDLGPHQPAAIDHIATDVESLTLVFPFCEMTTAESVYSSRAPATFAAFLEQVQPALEALFARLDPFGGTPTEVARLSAASFKGADIRNLGVQQVENGTDCTRIFDLGHAYQAEPGDLGAKYLVSILLMNWGSNPIKCLRWVSSDLIQPMMYLAHATTEQRVRVEVREQMRVRRRHAQAGTAPGRLAKRVGFQTLGRWYAFGMSRLVRQTFQMAERNSPSTMYDTVTRRHYRDVDVAAEYDRRLSASPLDRLITRLETRSISRALSELEAVPGSVVLDVPSGTGKLMPLFARLKLTAVSLDISAEMIAHSTVPRPVVGDVECLPFASGAFHHALSLRLFHRVPELVVERGIGELCRVAKSGVIVFYAAEPRLDAIRRRLKRLLRRQRTSWTMLTPPRLASMFPEGWQVISDRALAPAYLSGRVVTARRAVST